MVARKRRRVRVLASHFACCGKAAKTRRTGIGSRVLLLSVTARAWNGENEWPVKDAADERIVLRALVKLDGPRSRTEARLPLRGRRQGALGSSEPGGRSRACPRTRLGALARTATGEAGASGKPSAATSRTALSPRTRAPRGAAPREPAAPHRRRRRRASGSLLSTCAASSWLGTLRRCGSGVYGW